VSREGRQCSLARCSLVSGTIVVEVDDDRSFPHVVAFSVLIASPLRATPVAATRRRSAACFSMTQFQVPGNL
jgi:hypothetical protein